MIESSNCLSPYLATIGTAKMKGDPSAVPKRRKTRNGKRENGNSPLTPSNSSHDRKFERGKIEVKESGSRG